MSGVVPKLIQPPLPTVILPSPLALKGRRADVGPIPSTRHATAGEDRGVSDRGYHDASLAEGPPGGVLRIGPDGRMGPGGGRPGRDSLGPGDQRGRHGVHDGLCRAGHADDPRPRPLLWRDGPPQERAGDVPAELHHARRGRLAVGPLRLQPRLRPRRRRQGPHRRPRLRRAQRGRPRPAPDLRADDPAPALHGLSAHVRRHHPRADLGGVRRADEVLVVPDVHTPLGDVRLRPRRALGLGRRLDRRAARGARLCWWPGRPRDLGRRRPLCRARDGQAEGARRGGDAPAQPDDDRPGDRPALVRLVLASTPAVLPCRRASWRSGRS